jgi:UDP-N-acetylmuramoyl-tripeptide--D-alanyl-D-alanine ligase
MMQWSLAEIAQILGVVGYEDTLIGVQRVQTDSRVVCAGDLFVALPGTRVDGHDFIGDVAQKGAVAALVTRLVAGVSLPQLVVPDVVLAMQTPAHAWRKQQQWSPCITVTGSNGKTSVKEMLAAVLRVHLGQEAVLATFGNLNNHLGLPMTLLSGRAEHQAAVIEVGANHVGEIAQLAPLAEADTAIITSIGLAHVGEFGGLAAIIAAKAEVFQALPVGGVAVVPVVPVGTEEDGWEIWQPLLTQQRVVGAGMLADVHVSRGWSAWVGVAGREVFSSGQMIHLKSSHWGDASITLSLLGAHHARNVAVVCSALLANDVPWAVIQQGLSELSAPKGRLQRIALTERVILIDDSYNANPSSMLAAVQTLKEQPADRLILVLGDMGELGEAADALHAQVGKAAVAADIDVVLATGQYADKTVAGAGARGVVCQTIEDVCMHIQALLSGDQVTAILVKGSRSSRMERVVDGLKEQMLVTAHKPRWVNL